MSTSLLLCHLSYTKFNLRVCLVLKQGTEHGHLKRPYAENVHENVLICNAFRSFAVTIYEKKIYF